MLAPIRTSCSPIHSGGWSVSILMSSRVPSAQCVSANRASFSTSSDQRRFRLPPPRGPLRQAGKGKVSCVTTRWPTRISFDRPVCGSMGGARPTAQVSRAAPVQRCSRSRGEHEAAGRTPSGPGGGRQARFPGYWAARAASRCRPRVAHRERLLVSRACWRSAICCDPASCAAATAIPDGAAQGRPSAS